MSTFYLLWQDLETRQWHPAGRLDRVADRYVFAYVKSAVRSPRFVPFAGLSKTDAVYVSELLFPIFANRVLSGKRPEFPTYARWAGYAPHEQPDPLTLTAQMGGIKATDNLQVYAVPERDPKGFYQTTFFCHGTSHLPIATQDATEVLAEGTQLFPMLDIQNPFDAKAVALRTSDPTNLIGYCPRHLAPDISRLSRETESPLKIIVKRVNRDAPVQYRVLCQAHCSWPKDFQPCAGDEYSTVSSYDPGEIVAYLAKREEAHVRVGAT